MFKKLFGSKGEKPLSKADYSFGLRESLIIKQQLDKKEYGQVEELLSKLDSDNLSHVVDHLSLNTKESELIKWYDSKNQSDAASLVLGVFYAHKGWWCRGHGVASEVTEEGALGFLDYESKAEGILTKISGNKLYVAEAHCRLIRVYMSLGDREQMLQSFNKCVSLDPLKVWAYVHKLEAIEPKWGGSKEEVSELLNQLPDSKLISDIVNMKLLGDSFTWEEWLADDENINVVEEAKSRIRSIDRELTSSPHQSILRFMVYGYIVNLSQNTGDKDLLNKYAGKMENHYTLYPFGMTK